ncbi:MAG: GntR family transcriptional regulator [Candidatus Hydrogenedentes bacterium]|nr:GntR family transcriptional regulator [Candidatus Hydrogenedentota bacterium]
MIRINTQDRTPIYLQIIRQVKYLIATGMLKEGDELPTVRMLAQQLLVNPSTVAKAYRELESEGLIYSRTGSGTYVAPTRVIFSNEERNRILYEHIDTLLVISANLRFSLDQLLELIQTRAKEINIYKEKE